MGEIEEDNDDQFLSLIEQAEADAIDSARIAKRQKLSGTASGDESCPQDNQEEGSYMAALRGSRSSLWKLQQQHLNLHNKGGGVASLSSGSNSTAPSSTMVGGSCFKCGMMGHWARECGGGHDGSVDRTGSLVAEKHCPCGSGTCLILTSNTAKNPGRMFYRCPLKAENGGCNFFEWCDTPSSAITLDGQSSAQVPVLLCPCGAGSCLVLVSKNGKNEGQQYYKCPANGGRGSCGFFKWCNEQGSVPRQSSFSQQFQGSSNISNCWSSADKSNSSCFKCGQEGHWAKDCQNQSSNSFVSEGKNQLSSGSCFKCGKAGHWARDCPAQSNVATASGAKRYFGSSQSS
ncbi:DNA-binding protein HEXBP isoform X2 [Dendrobium catenatum]|uniref:DNA-binding protein HEXBP isoform X2 n=1 Tax=Dendrobium catenatum TaxID=906689 RepID=UPI00109FC5F2|nr:DNA-binding protein HEXBP isoform X2 [Dendrobium catenatum]